MTWQRLPWSFCSSDAAAVDAALFGYYIVVTSLAQPGDSDADGRNLVSSGFDLHSLADTHCQKLIGQ